MQGKSLRILIIEDSSEILKLIVLRIKSELGVELDIAENLEGGIYLISQKPYDLISIDIQLPDGNGLDLLTSPTFQTHQTQAKTIVLTTQTDLQTRLSTFTKGADDYLPKPFYPSEYIARIKRLLNWPVPTKQNRILTLHEGLKLNLDTSQITIGQSKVALTQLELTLLKYLFENAGVPNNSGLISFLELELGRVVDTKSLRVAVGRLREKLYRVTGTRLVRTRVNRGYYVPKYL